MSHDFAYSIFQLKKLLKSILMKRFFLFILITMLAADISAQTVVVTDDSTYTSGQASSVLDVKSTSKGFLPPRMTQAQRTAITSPASGLVVFQTDSTDGLYYFKDGAWVIITNGAQAVNAVVKTVNDTLQKTETFVLARNNITVTLPAITGADDGLSIAIKNGGTYTDLVTIKASGSAKIDSQAFIPLVPWYAFTFVAKGGNWYAKDRGTVYVNTMIVSSISPWNTLDKAIGFLNAHMWSAAVISIESGTYSISSTINIDLPYPLTIEGSSYGMTTIGAATGLSGNPMFTVASECYFKMLDIDATTLSGYGNSTGEDAIHITGSNQYYEIKDCEFDHFNKAIVLQNNSELWLFESDINDAVVAGVEVAAGTSTGVILKASEIDFTACAKGINLLSGIGGTLSVTNCGYYNSGGSIGINYVPATFTSLGPVFISNCTWNNTGTFINGFDFTRSDGRDASVAIVNNIGVADQRPSCKINVLNNATTVSVGTSWVKANWNSSVQTQTLTKFTVATNKLTYQPANHRDLVMWISGNVSCTGSDKTINIGIAKNGVSTVRYGETTLRVTTSNQPFQWSTVVYLSNVAPGDYFEIWAADASSTNTYTFQDINWFTDSQ